MTYFYVEGIPAPKGSKNCFCRGGRGVVVDVSPERLRKWEGAVAAAVSGSERLTGAVSALLLFVMPKPKTSKNYYPVVPPDIDKLARAVLDGLVKGGILADDALIVDLNVGKRYLGDPRIPEYDRTGVSIEINSVP